MNELVFEIQRLYPQIFHACHTRHVRRRSTPFALTERDSALLAHVDRRYGIAASDLARHMGVGEPTMSAAVRRLERLGYVTRKPRSRDRRTIEIRLTEAGAQALSAGSVLDAERVRLVVERLTPDERRTAIAGLEFLSRAARAIPRKEGRR